MLASAVFITCAVTGSGDSVRKNAHVPVTPEQIATSALEAHEAGAAIVHVHVRDPASAGPSRDPAPFRLAFERIRAGKTSRKSHGARLAPADADSRRAHV